MKHLLAAVAAFTLAAAGAHATTYDLALDGKLSDFTTGSLEFQGLHFEQYSLYLTSPGFPITVSQGDTINTTVTFDGLVNIPTSQVRTDLVQYLGGSSFPQVNTQVDGAYTFYNAGVFVASYNFSSTTSGGLSTYSALFPPSNAAFSFDSFTDNFVVTTLPSPGTIERSSFTYSLVSNGAAAPEPASWALMILGFGGVGAAMRRRRAPARA